MSTLGMSYLIEVLLMLFFCDYHITYPNIVTKECCLYLIKVVLMKTICNYNILIPL